MYILGKKESEVISRPLNVVHKFRGNEGTRAYLKTIFEMYKLLQVPADLSKENYYSDQSKMTDQKLSEGQVMNGSDRIARHLVSLPTIILTRIDVNALKSFETQHFTVKKSPNNVTLKKKNATSLLKPHVKNLSLNNLVGRPRGRPKKEVNTNQKTPKQTKKSVKPGLLIPSTNKTLNKPKLVTNPQISTAKSILQKTMLQKKSKIVIPQTKKPKSVKKANNRQTPQKLVTNKKQPPKKLSLMEEQSQQVLNKLSKQTQKTMKKRKPNSQKLIKPSLLDINSKSPILNTVDTDSSEDEFLYDELIGELESNFSKYITTEKTTNITLKPNAGNKPPTIVKGGIIKIDNLPADLKTIASPGQLLAKTKTNEPFPNKRTKSPQTESPIPQKKPSPWPITMSSPTKLSNNTSANKKNPISNTISNSHVKPTTAISQQKPWNETPVSNTKKPDHGLVVETQPILPKSGKHKIGPKLFTNKDHLAKSFDEEENLSDEYTDIETLENVDYNTDDNLSVKETGNYVSSTRSSQNPTLTYVGSINDEDPNIDLLRILSDESEDCTPKPCEDSKSKTNEIRSSIATVDVKIHKGICHPENNTNISSHPEETTIELEMNKTPKVRTIYDLINEVSLQRPSWNLHIVPETNAFCIAQVTKGRLGLPTLKKCIELDPENYNAKVYIHQYHIKRFDGIYDSEESILALIEEIDSIKA